MRLLRALLVAIVPLAAGTWVGIGQPDVRTVRGTVEDAVRSSPIVASGAASSPARAPESQSLPPDEPPLPYARDPSLIPSIEPWPRTNPETTITRAWMVAEGPRKQPGDNRRLVTLTFDDGPTPEATPDVLRLLRRHHVRATFFVIGRYLDGRSSRAKRSREILRKVVAAGHLVGNHTHDHANLTRVTHEELVDQIDRGAASIERVTGARPVLFRPPYGRLDAFGERVVHDRNLELLLWSVEKKDMERDDPDEMFHDLVAQLDYKQGGVVLLHDVKPSSVRVLERLLDFLRDRPYDPAHPSKFGYEIVDLPHYLRAVADSPMPYADRDDLERARGSAGTQKHSAKPAPES